MTPKEAEKVKINKLKAELEKAKEKAAEWQARVRDLEKQVTECENLEIVRTVRDLAASPEELRGLLDMLRTTGKPPATADTTKTIMPNKEDTENED